MPSAEELGQVAQRYGIEVVGHHAGSASGMARPLRMSASPAALNSRRVHDVSPRQVAAFRIADSAPFRWQPSYSGRRAR